MGRTHCRSGRRFHLEPLISQDLRRPPFTLKSSVVQTELTGERAVVLGWAPELALTATSLAASLAVWKRIFNKMSGFNH